jgi:hypothetical protein
MAYKTCPVCHQGNIPSLGVRCPSCGTSFSGFSLIETLKEQRDAELVTYTKMQSESLSLRKQLKQKAKSLTRFRWLFVLAFVALLFTLPKYFRKSVPQEEHDALFKKHQLLADSVKHQAAKLLELGRIKPLCISFYVLNDKETLLDVAKERLGDARLAYYLKQYNRIEDTHSLNQGDTVYYHCELSLLK